MKLSVSKSAELPPLAWLARIEGCEAIVLCGASVHVEDTLFFEGAWASHGRARSMQNASEVFGSGMVWDGESWIVVTPSHLLECVYVLRNQVWWASNSLAFLKAKAGFTFDALKRDPLRGLASAAAALCEEPLAVETTKGNLFPIYHHNAVLAETLHVLPKPRVPRFFDYQDYRAYLLATLGEVGARGCRPFLATTSSGYDSVACAALVSALGARDTLSFRSARGGADDSGAECAKALGLRTIELARPTGVTQSVADLFNCCGLGGEDALYAAASEHLRDRILVTGFHGDKVWDLHAHANDHLSRGDLSGASLGEFRIRNNFIHVPAPFIGACNHEDIRNIAQGPSMSAHRVGGAYDRPVARRMGEDAGVPRAAFGQSKKAVSLRRRLDWRGASFAARLQFAAGVLWWRLLHGGARRVWLPLRSHALRTAEASFSAIFKTSFAVFEHTSRPALATFMTALHRVATDYARWESPSLPSAASAARVAEAHAVSKARRSAMPNTLAWRLAIRDAKSANRAR